MTEPVLYEAFLVDGVPVRFVPRKVYWYCPDCTPAGRECDAEGIKGEGHWAVKP